MKVSEKHEHIKEEMTDEVLYQAIFDTSLAGFFVVDTDGVILKANPAAERIFGYAIEELLHTNIDIIFSDEYKNEFKIQMKEPVSEPVQILGFRKYGSVFLMDLRIAPTVSEGRTIAAVYCKP
ncbi:MAG: PAS domain S-box protein, partial [Pricia sp.]|nr:PAS domain S-box protein [Pricia sp.]